MKPITPLYLVDAFAHRPFGGNPAAVCLLPAPQPDDWMQNVAAEMNQAETAFLLQQADGSFSLRWFTPTVEVELCGHATLASAHVIWEVDLAPREEVLRFQTLSGILTARNANQKIELDFPAEPCFPVAAPEGLAQALGAELVFTGRNRMDYLVELKDEATVRALQPDLAVLKQLPVRGIIVTAASSDSRYDFVSRFFGPAAGIDEDPVTGSAHCCLAPYWKEKSGKHLFTGFQASKRGGEVETEVKGARVLLRGAARTVMQGVWKNGI